MQRLMPNADVTLRNSVSGVLIGSLSVLPAILAQWVYSSTIYSLFCFVGFFAWFYFAKRLNLIK
jgi:hypothetical protein